MWMLKDVHFYADYAEWDNKAGLKLDTYGKGKSGKNWDGSIDLGPILVEKPDDIIPKLQSVFRLPAKGFNPATIDGTDAEIVGNFRIDELGNLATIADIQAWKNGQKELWSLEVIATLENADIGTWKSGEF